MNDDDMCSTVLPTPQWLKELGQQIAAEYKLGTVDAMCITGMICTAIRKNMPEGTMFWITADKSHDCYVISKNRPRLSINTMTHEKRWKLYSAKKDVALISPLGLFPQVTFENSPKQVELKIIDDEQHD